MPDMVNLEAILIKILAHMGFIYKLFFLKLLKTKEIVKICLSFQEKMNSCFETKLKLKLRIPFFIFYSQDVKKYYVSEASSQSEESQAQLLGVCSNVKPSSLQTQNYF